MEVINTIGRRKASVARVYMSKGKGKITINDKGAEEYFPIPTQQYKLKQPFALTETVGQFDVNVNVDGGGTTGQVEAIRMAISRALVELDEENKPKLKEHGLMTRDPRMVERKKPGQKKARKKFQFSKR
ncbi:MAG: 30S ribosomal protein S9 [Flavobacteriales bacterium]|nr:30S ribosomal protein S9 [Flavobacteriales bacterium]